MSVIAQSCLRCCPLLCSCCRRARAASTAAPTTAPAPTTAAAAKPTARRPPPRPARRRPPAPRPSPAAAASPAAKPAASPAAASPAASPQPSRVAETGAAAARAAPESGCPNAASRGRRQEAQVGLVTDVGKVDDKSFNQSAWEGVQCAQKNLGADVKFIETTDPKDYGKNIDQFAQDNYDVIVTVGFALGDDTIAEAKKYPNIKFIGVDQFQADTVANLAGLIFDEDKAGYLAGYLAGSLTKSGTVGQVLGTPIVPPVEKYGVGYINGAKAAKPGIKVLSACHPGGLAKGFTDPGWGKDTANQEMSQSADVIFAAGGQTGNGGLLAIAEQGRLGAGHRRRHRPVPVAAGGQEHPGLERDEADHAGRVRHRQGGPGRHVQGRQRHRRRRAWRRTTTWIRRCRPTSRPR